MATLKPILMIDDRIDFGEDFVDSLKRRGFAVQYFPRALIEGETIKLMECDGTLHVLDPSRYSLALVDGKIKGGDFHGSDLTPLMVKAGMTVVAISGSKGLNDELVDLGAIAGIYKHELLDAVDSGLLDLRKLAPEAKV
jgi:hypothetical protein